MKREFDLSSRRKFFRDATATMAILNVIASQRADAGEPARKNPFAYDVSPLQKTDPKLIAYEEKSRLKAPHTEARRIAIGSNNALCICSGNYLTAMKPGGETLLES